MRNRGEAASPGRWRGPRDHGAVVVETALMLPILLLLLFGIIEFGRLYNAQISLTHAAREGVREYVITGDAAQGSSTAIAAVPNLGASDLTVALSTTCDPEDDAVVGTAITMTVTYTDFVGFIPLWGDLNDIDLVGTGTMRCGG